jgi:hypothetical protein
MISWRWRFALGSACAVIACLDNPTIDGSKVPPDTDPNPTCAEICTRLGMLCGYEPSGEAGCTTPDASGYCDTTFTSDQLACIATVTSCRQAWDSVGTTGCLYVPPSADDGGDDGGSDAANDAANDAPSE